MGILNLQTGRQASVELVGLKEVQKQIKAIMDAAVGEEAAKVAAEAGQYVLNQMESHAQAVGVPKDVLLDLFLNTSRPGAEGAGSVTVLVGLKKRGTGVPAHAYRTWNAGRQRGQFDKTSRTRSKGKRLSIGGTKIGENLGTMWELGTTKMAARPWFRPTLMSVRDAVYAAMDAGYEAIIEKHSKE